LSALPPSLVRLSVSSALAAQPAADSSASLQTSRPKAPPSAPSCPPRSPAHGRASSTIGTSRFCTHLRSTTAPSIASAISRSRPRPRRLRRRPVRLDPLPPPAWRSTAGGTRTRRTLALTGPPADGRPKTSGAGCLPRRSTLAGTRTPTWCSPPTPTATRTSL
jgi:hypothetical protein